MAKRQIDAFKVKPSGLFAKWRGRVVYFNDETLEVTSGCPSNGECMNLPNIGDYKKNTRMYKNGQLITAFCSANPLYPNTRIEIFAQDQEPFAYVELTADSPKCGYVEPDLPPQPVPMPEVSYGLYKFYESPLLKINPSDQSEETRTGRIEIYKKEYTGEASEITHAGVSPVIKRYVGEIDNKFSPFIGLEVELSFIANESFDLSELYSYDEREYRVDLLIDGKLDCRTFIMPDICSELFENTPYEVKIKCTDVLGAMKTIPYPLAKFSTSSPRQTLIQILTNCFIASGIKLPLYTSDNLYELKHSKGLDDDPLAQTTINPLRLVGNAGKVLSVYEVLVEIAKLRGARIFQENGAWNFVRLNELSNDILRRRKYTETGLFLFSEQLSIVKEAGLRKPVELINADHSIFIGAPYKQQHVIFKFNTAPSTILNGDFQAWDGNNFDNWTAYGGIQFSRTEKKLGKISLGDYALTFKEEFNKLKFITPAPILVNAGEGITLNMNIQSIGPIDIFYFKARVENFYIKNKDGAIGDELEWGSINGFARHVISGIKQIESYVMSINLGKVPVSGELKLEFYGFEKYRENHIRIEKVSYNPVSIDNVSLERQVSDVNSKAATSISYVSEQERYFTFVPKPITVLFGDSGVGDAAQVKYDAQGKPVRSAGASNIPESDGIDITPPIRPYRGGGYVDPSLLGYLYRLDGSGTQSWTDYGTNLTNMPVGLHLAKSIVTAYQKPFKTFEGDFRSKDLLFLNTIEIQEETMKGRRFIFHGAEFDVFNNRVNGTILSEIFGKAPKTVDIPNIPGDTLPPIIQNPNLPSGSSKVTGIFSGQFNTMFS